MTPIRPQFNSTLFAINTLNSIAASNNFSGMDSNIFGNASLYGMNSFATEMSLFGQMLQSQNLNFQMPIMPTPTYSMPAFPQFNFDFSSFTMPQINFGSLLTSRPASNLSFTSNRAQNALQVASSQVGVREIGSSNNGADVNKYRNGVQDGSAWCASFVSYCYGRGQGSDNSKTFGYDASSQSIKNKAQKAGFYQKARTNYVPKAGDIAVWSNGDGTGHVGIVSKTNPDGSFETIEGNCSNQVARVTRRMSDAKLDGFVQMNEWLEA